MMKPILRKEFVSTETFGALRAAEEWLSIHGFSCGSNQRGAPTGVMHGDYEISKWRNLNRDERQSLDGIIEAGNHRNGPVVIVIFDTAQESALSVVQGFVDAA